MVIGELHPHTNNKVQLLPSVAVGFSVGIIHFSHCEAAGILVTAFVHSLPVASLLLEI